MRLVSHNFQVVVIAFLLLFFLAMPLGASVFTQPNFKQWAALSKVIHVIKVVLGSEHLIARKLDNLRTKRKIFVTTGEKSFDVFRIGIFISERSLNRVPIVGNSNSAAFWSLLAIVLHETMHDTYWVFDPEAGRRTSKLLRNFFPRPYGSTIQPFPALHHRSCSELRDIFDHVRASVWWEGLLSYRRRDDTSIPGLISTPDENIQRNYQNMRNIILGRLKKNALSYSASKKLLLQWAPIKRDIEKYWDVTLNSCDINCFIRHDRIGYSPTKIENSIKCNKSKP